MHSFLDALGFTCAFMTCIILLIVGLITLAHLFVQDFIDRHERRHHRRDADRDATTPTTDGK
jgi:quinol-cytochrome oxidoreductase complex cytochrome b subunit